MEIGSTVLLPSGRVGRQVAINRSDKPVFIDNEGKLVCNHGERAPSIMCWLASERTDPTFVRPSVCDCGNIDGLMTEYQIKESDRPKPPSAEQPLYKFLGTVGAEETIMNTRPQRKALVTRHGEIWVQPAGTLVCKHGNTRKTLAKIANGNLCFKRKPCMLCKCSLKIPRRVGSIFVSKTGSSKTVCEPVMME
jgi:hypothetical protein